MQTIKRLMDSIGRFYERGKKFLLTKVFLDLSTSPCYGKNSTGCRMVSPFLYFSAQKFDQSNVAINITTYRLI